MRALYISRLRPQENVASFEVREFKIQIMDYYAELYRADVIVHYQSSKRQKNLRTKLEKDLAQLANWKLRSTNPVQDFLPIPYSVPLLAQAALEQSIKALEEDIRILRKEKELEERRILSLRDIEIRHLRNLAKKEPFIYERRSAFIDELRKLRSLGLTTNRTKIGDIPPAGNLKDHIELTDLTREVLEDLFRRFAE